MAFSKPISNKLKWQRRWFVCLLLSLCMLPLVSQVAKLLKLHADDALVNNEQLLLPYLLGNGKKKKQHHRHPLSRENENITEADLLNRCCIWLVKRDEAFKQRVYASYASVYGGWDFKTSNRSHPDSVNLASFKGPAPQIRASQDENMNSWNETASFYAEEKGGVSASFPPLMYYAPFANHHPAHCMQDVIFSMLPMAYRGELQGVTLVQIESEDERPRDNYCNHVIDALGWFDEHRIFPNYTCFEKLWVPAFMHYRFPSKVRGGSDAVIFNSNGYLHKEDLPIDMLVYLQQQLWKGVGLHHDSDCKDQIILIESRIGWGRRIFKDAYAIGEMLQEKYNRTVKIVDSFSGLSLKEQAAIFHSASVFIGPHSGSNANLIFMKNGSHVFEIHCMGGSWARDWLLDLGIHHIPVLPDNPPCSDHDAKEMSVKNSTILELVSKIFDSKEDKC